VRKSILVALLLTGTTLIGVVFSFTSLGNVQISYKIVVPTAQISTLVDREYYYSIIEDIRNANSCIMVAMYSMIYDPDDTFDWANDLIRELVHAKEMGVNVTVILEYRTYWGYMDENLDAYDYLSVNGVEVLLDTDTETDHMKLVIIDNYIVYVGSHNWSESGLYYNKEISIKMVSSELAKEYEEYFWTIRKS
jgi:phosphatidylserine/phosphatidylglycerophosphate/cardiolipin synthase-like enzyme